MIRRRSLDVWPAFADLMTVLAVVGIFMTLALNYEGKSKEELLARLRESERRQRELQSQLEREKLTRERHEREWNEARRQLQEQVREAVQNEKMFQAIQEAQRFIDAISNHSGLTFGADQSLQFGDDLVSFELNGVRPIWKKDSQDRLRKFCIAISGELAGLQEGENAMRRLFVVQIEGHTDSTRCQDDPDCNWSISSQRAAAFLAFMRQERYCPGGGAWRIRPVGYADQKLLFGGAPPTRRIAVRLIPDYEGIISSFFSSPDVGKITP